MCWEGVVDDVVVVTMCCIGDDVAGITRVVVRCVGDSSGCGDVIVDGGDGVVGVGIGVGVWRCRASRVGMLVGDVVVFVCDLHMCHPYVVIDVFPLGVTMVFSYVFPVLCLRWFFL